MYLYLFWRDDVVKKAINKLDKKIEYVEDGYYPLEEDIDLEDADQELLQPLDKSEKEYVMLELSIKRQNILKNDKKVKILFALSGLAFIICGFMLMG